MRIGIIGAGSIGLLFASYLSEKSEVTIFTKTKEQAIELNENGVVRIKDNFYSKKKIAALPIEDWDGLEDLTIIAVKQYQLPSLIDKISSISSKKLSILFLQNGMGHLKLLHHLEAHDIFLGSVEHGALKENSYTVRHNGEGVTNIAVYKGDLSALISLSSMSSEGFLFKCNDNYYEMLLNKLIINAVINPLTAVLQVKNGMLIKNAFYFNVLKNLFTEITNILNILESESYFQKVIEVCQKTAGNSSSMFKDIESGRETEVDAILGFILEEAQAQKKEAPLIKTFYFLVKGKEADKNLNENKQSFF